MPGPQPCHCRPFIFCIVGRGLDRLTAHNERRQPAKLARSCGCLPCRGKHCSLPDFAPLNRGPTLTTPHLRGASRTPPHTTAIRKLFHNRKRARRPEGRPPYVLPLTEFAGKNSSLPGRIPISQTKRSCRRSIVSTTFRIYTNLRLPEPAQELHGLCICLLYTSPSPRDRG